MSEGIICMVVLRALGLESERAGAGETGGQCRGGPVRPRGCAAALGGETEAASHLPLPWVWR